MSLDDWYENEGVRGNEDRAPALNPWITATLDSLYGAAISIFSNDEAGVAARRRLAEDAMEMAKRRSRFSTAEIAQLKAGQVTFFEKLGFGLVNDWRFGSWDGSHFDFIESTVAGVFDVPGSQFAQALCEAVVRKLRLDGYEQRVWTASSFGHPEQRAPQFLRILLDFAQLKGVSASDLASEIQKAVLDGSGERRILRCSGLEEFNAAITHELLHRRVQGMVDALSPDDAPSVPPAPARSRRAAI